MTRKHARVWVKHMYTHLPSNEMAAAPLESAILRARDRIRESPICKMDLNACLQTRVLWPVLAFSKKNVVSKYRGFFFEARILIAGCHSYLSFRFATFMNLEMNCCCEALCNFVKSTRIFSIIDLENILKHCDLQVHGPISVHCTLRRVLRFHADGFAIRRFIVGSNVLI